MSNTYFLQPRLTGKRFENHSIPLDFLSDLAALQGILTDIAKAEFRRKNPQKQRIPKNFTNGIELGLSQIEEGSAKPVLNFIFTAAFGLFPTHPAIPYYNAARDTFAEAVKTIETTGNIPDSIPSSTIRLFNRFGQHFLDDEGIEFPRHDGQPAIYTKMIREKIIRQAAPEVLCQKTFLRGYVTDFNAEKTIWTFQSIDGQRFICPLTEQIRETVHHAVKDYNPNSPNNVKIALEGEVSVSGADVKMDTIEDVSILDSLDVGGRLDELKLLKQGWLDGEQGSPLDKEKLDWLTGAFDWLYPDTLPLPYLFPSPEGNVQAEWQIENFNVELEINLADQTGTCWIMDMRRETNPETDKEFSLDLKKEDDWNRFASVIQELQKYNAGNIVAPSS